ncbi:unnamed protein product, partial [Durusdinium trenchii]
KSSADRPPAFLERPSEPDPLRAAGPATCGGSCGCRGRRFSGAIVGECQAATHQTAESGGGRA